MYQGLRSRFVLGALVAGLLTLSVGENRAQAQQGKYVTEASARLIKLINNANGNGYKLHDNTFSIGGGWLKQSNTWVDLFTMNLQAGKEYRFLAAGDADARDVDLQIVDANGNVVAADVATNPEAVVNFTPQNNGRYLVRVRLFSSDNSLPCVCLAIALAK